MIYVVTNIATGEEVYRYDADAPIEWQGMEFATHEHVAAPEDAALATDTRLFAGRRRLTKLEFVALLGDAAHKSILTTAKQSVEIEAFVQLVDWAAVDANGWSVNLDDPRMVQLSELEPTLIALGAVTEGWAQGVLNG